MTREFLVAAVLAGGGLSFSQAAVQAQTTGTRAVPTYEAVGLYWSSPGANVATGCEVKFRKTGATAWTQGLAMWFDARNNECRGSLVNLIPGTDYQVEMNLPGQPTARSLSFKTWSNQKPIAKTITVPSGSATLNITEAGSAAGYVVYQGAPGAVLNANNAVPFNVSVNASYVIVRGLTLKGAQQDAIRISPTVSDVVIEDNEITGWGRLRSGTLGVDRDSAIRANCQTPTLERVTIQRNEIHDPRYGANSWSDGHPEGPQAITISFCGGNHVIRHNEIYSSAGHYYNDIIGGEDNYSTTGFPNADTDIYGNELSHSWDDAIEAEGGNRNVRIWGNYMDQTGTAIASTITAIGPLYMFRNVYNRSRMLEKVPLDQDTRQVMFKSGSDATFGDGRRYVFHNTMLQATQAGVLYGLGASGGVTGTSATALLNNTVSRNNIFHNWRTWTAYDDVGVGNDLANDMFNGTSGVPGVTGISATPIYALGNGWTSEAGGQYQLAPNTPGYDQGARIANFNDVYYGAAPDVGAHEGGSARMRFGIAASPGPSVSIPVRSFDFNADGMPDIIWSNTSSGATYVWYMNGPLLIVDAFIAQIDPSWKVQGVADFNGDGKPDLVWRNTASGNTYLWYMDGPRLVSDAFLFGLPPQWLIQGVADFNADGRPDFLMRNVTTGVASAWFFDHSTPVGDQFLFTIDPAWKVEQVGDINGDGQPDLLFRNTSSGLGFAWYTRYSGGNLSLGGSSAPIFSIDPKWEIVQLADWNADGSPDLLFRNRDSGLVFVWYMTGTTLGASDFIIQINPSWEIVPRR